MNNTIIKRMLLQIFPSLKHASVDLRDVINKMSVSCVNLKPYSATCHLTKLQLLDGLSGRLSEGLITVM